MEPNDENEKLVKIDNLHTETQMSMNNVISHREMTEKLIQIVGTYEDIKHRQEMFRIMNLINGYGDVDSVSFSSGSLAEGLDIKGSDEDITLIFKYITAVPPYGAFVPKNDETVVLVDLTRTSQDLPRFVHCLTHLSTQLCRRRLCYHLGTLESSSLRVVKIPMVLVLMMVNVTSLFASAVPFCQILLSNDLNIGNQNGYRKTFWVIYWLMVVLWFLLVQGIPRNEVYCGEYHLLLLNKKLF